MKNPKTKIIIVDDCHHFRTGLRFFLEIECNCEVIAEAENGAEFLKLKNIYNADVVLMDLMMPEKGGYETTFEAIHLYRNIKIIAVTQEQDFAYLLLLMQSGFKACVFKPNVFEEIVFAIDKVMAGEYYVPEGIRI
jgi:DNA-binding NarL/FixJ family response regulator